MARATNVIVKSSTILALDMKKSFKRDENNKPIANLIFTVNGTPNMASAQRKACELVKHKNVMIIGIIKNENETFTLSADVFIANSKVCEPNVSYGHDFVTREFSVTQVDATYIDDNFEIITETIVYNGKTTTNKLLNFAREYFNNNNVVIDESTIVVKNEKRYMSKDTYMELGRKQNKDNDDNNNEE